MHKEELLKRLINEVNAENLYAHVLAMQGVRHPVTGLEGLVRAREYMKERLREYGLEVKTESFRVEGCDAEFENIVGVLDRSGGESPELVISSHHDTVFNAPGANDNGSACAVVLELARVFSMFRDELPEKVHVRFVSFDLEEQHPGIEKRLVEIGEETGFKRGREYTRLKYKQDYDALFPLGSSLWKKKDRESAKKKMRELSLDEVEQAYFNEILRFGDDAFRDEAWVGNYALLGSEQYVKNAVKENRQILGVINLDTIAYTSKLPGSQRFPKGFPVRLLKILSMKGIRRIVRLKMFRAEYVEDITRGDYISLISTPKSSFLAQKYFQEAKKLELPITMIALPYEYERIVKEMPDMLRSDHAPFWKNEVPGIFLSDSANFRYPFYHTESDVIRHLDFVFLRKVAQATARTALNVMLGEE